ncbi:MAG: hypothetical protein M3O67_00600, partial [Bacteroidota bacterium]|nr:hypothetical protein [Bacteroidota bacterium]
MNEFLDQVIWGNTVRNYFIVFGVISFVLLLKRLISRYFAGLLFRLLQKAWRNLDKKSFTDLLIQPLSIFFVIFISIIALHKLRFPEELNVEIYKYTLKQIIHAAATIVIVVTFIWFLLRIIDFIALILQQKANLTPDQSDNQLVVIFKDFFKVVFMII